MLLIIILLAIFICHQRCLSQGFVNLDFETAVIIPDTNSPYYPYGIQTTNALPGWTVYRGNNTQSQITYDAPAVGSTWVSLITTKANNIGWLPISGKYSVLLQGGFSLSSATISQNGLVPIGAESLLFEAQPGFGTLDVSLGGQSLSFFALSSGANYTLYGADISAFAGQTQQLSFSALRDIQIANDWNIDNIQFSSTAVPEPGTLALAVVGTLLLGYRRWRKNF